LESLQNKVALITGGSKGIGFGIAKALVSHGMKVAITGRSAQPVNQATSVLHTLGKGESIGIVSDVKDLSSQKSAVEKIIALWHSLDVVVANAGVGHFAPIESMAVEAWKEIIDTNLTGVFYSLKATFDALKNSKGYFITISSLAGANFFAGGAAYNASKFGLTGFTQAAMLDLRKHGIRVSTIMPGSVATSFNDHESSPRDAWKIQPDDIGLLVVQLLSMDPRTLPSKIEVRPSQPPGN
jgi:3-oxoacyl-[acyl-carrier protein] reductase